jgi:hypothetical protein
MDFLKDLYVLEGHNVRQAKSMEEWGRCFDSPERIVAVAEDEYFKLSTVFLGARHNHFRPGPPILFETMVFATDAYRALIPESKSLDLIAQRYSSWDDAETGHITMLKRLKKQIEFALEGGYQDAQQTNEHSLG